MIHANNTVVINYLSFILLRKNYGKILKLINTKEMYCCVNTLVYYKFN